METKTSADLIILGAGPAALTGALYAARAGISVQVFDREKIGGTLTEIPEITNYPGFVGSGEQLSRTMRAQAERAGAKIKYGDCTEIQHFSSGFDLTIDGDHFRARTVLVATGSNPRPLDFPVEPPVSYCALCDGNLVRDKVVAVLGGANSAAQEAIYLSSLAKQIDLITHSSLKADQYLQDRLKACQNVHIKEHLEPTAALLARYDRVFVFIGKTPATSFLRPLASSLLSTPPLLDDCGYVLTSLSFPAERCGAVSQQTISQPQTVVHQAISHQTVVPGLFAAGDVRAGSVHQAITAAGDGAAAAIEIINFLEALN